MYRLILVSVFLSVCLADLKPKRIPRYQELGAIQTRRFVKIFNTYDPCSEYENSSPGVINSDTETKCSRAFDLLGSLPLGDLPLLCLPSQRAGIPTCRNFGGEKRCMITAKYTSVDRQLGPKHIQTQELMMPVLLSACAETVGVGIRASADMEGLARDPPTPKSPKRSPSKSPRSSPISSPRSFRRS